MTTKGSLTTSLAHKTACPVPHGFVRPSGTEPKLKIYISVSAENKEMAEEVEDEIAKTAEKWIC